MAKTSSKVIVIDASILRTAGEPSKIDQRSAKCRQFLEAMRRICHRAILTPEMKVEWDKHQSNFGTRWRASMARIGKIVFSHIEIDQTLRSAIRDASPDKHIAEIMIKDARLIEAALASDQIVVSLDDKARLHFRDICVRITRLKRVSWINPNVKSDQYVKWMEEGAKSLKDHKLG